MLKFMKKMGFWKSRGWVRQKPPEIVQLDLFDPLNTARYFREEFHENKELLYAPKEAQDEPKGES